MRKWETKGKTMRRQLSKIPDRWLAALLLTLWALGLVLMFSGCKPAAPADPALAAASDFEAQLKARREKVGRLGTNGVDWNGVYVAVRQAGIPKEATYIYGDDVYVKPSSNWVTRDLAGVLRTEFFELGILSPVASAHAGSQGAFDCDDFADGAAFHAQVLARSALGSKAGVVFGVVYYTKEGLGRHAVNFSVTADAGVIFFEPQTLQEITLTPVERASVTFWRF